MEIMPARSITIKRLFFVAFITLFFTVNLTAAPDREAAKLSANPTISLDVTNEPLRSVFGRIYKTTAWKIKAPDKWMGRPVTQTLKEVKLEDGLRSILNSAGIENLLLLYDENIMVVTVFDTEVPQKQSAGGPSPQVIPTAQVVSANRPPAQVTARQPGVPEMDDPMLNRPARDSGSAPSPRSRRGSRQVDSDEE
jgi:hypothetical protein